MQETIASHTDIDVVSIRSGEAPLGTTARFRWPHGDCVCHSHLQILERQSMPQQPSTGERLESGVLEMVQEGSPLK